MMLPKSEHRRNSCDLSTILSLVIAIFMCANLMPCPACSIYNYLDGSIGSSKNIFIAKVLKAEGEDKVEAVILKVIRGKHGKGQKMTLEGIYDPKGKVGKRYIFSDPQLLPGPSFPCLEIEFEDEIMFLMQDIRLVGNLEEALKRIQGVSVASQNAGMDYIEKYHDEAIRPLIGQLEALRKEVIKRPNVFYGEHRIGQLIKAVLRVFMWVKSGQSVEASV